ncbi:hypothetical protein ACFFJY_14525 [Fictibacillus aquaticus]|uniref:Uncharacterized protein n=1 Tax=Fictibacillus aquaticus TaxID=2021314 RepID=A0A235FDZ8_9BACL|nr:hypothetical protein [Fictibacillus aquaticus]OYD59429.1 hypothetical protein CGZ90_05950 [Fictibacillus aquaticus]
MKRTLHITASQAVRLKDRTSGVTLFKPSGVRYSYPHIDLSSKMVTAIVTFENETVMTVKVDVKNDRVHVEGNVDGLEEISLDKESFLNMFKHQANYFIENNISSEEEWKERLRN